MHATTRTDVEQRAAAWLARRDGGAWTPADGQALDAWLAADTGHRVAFLRLQAAWTESGRLQALGAGWKAAGPPPRGHWSQPAQARGVALLASASAPAPLPAPPDLRDWRPAPRARRARPQLARAFATLSIAACALAASWGWQRYHHVDTAAYRTVLGGIETVALADGSQATLGSDSRLGVALSRRQRLIELQRGEAIFDVAKDAARPFVVDAGERQVVAVGTRFSVRRDAGALRVVVTEGTVRLDPRDASRPAALLPAGSVAVVDGDEVLVRSLPVADAQRLLDWRDGHLVFRDTTLADAAAEFNRFNARRIVVARDVGGLRISGSFRWDNAEGFARLLEKGFPVQARYAADRIELQAH